MEVIYKIYGKSLTDKRDYSTVKTDMVLIEVIPTDENEDVVSFRTDNGNVLIIPVSDLIELVEKIR